MSTFTCSNGAVAIAEENGRAVATFSGAIDDPKPDAFLEPVFEAFEAKARQSPAAVLDLVALSFLNSNGIKCLANYVRRHMAVPADQRYELTLRYTPAVTWQRATLKALATMARDAVRLEAV